LTAIIDPSRSVEGNYTVYTVLTESGRVYTGLLASETKTSVEVIEATGKKRVVLRENISSITASPKSLMPDGFEGLMSKDDVASRREFVLRRGRSLPLALDKVATAVSTRGMFYSEDAAAERLVFKDYKPKTFKGVPFHLVDPRGGKAANVV